MEPGIFSGLRQIVSVRGYYYIIVALAVGAAAGCGTTTSGGKKDDRFFTSGSAAADRRAERSVEEKDGGSKGSKARDEASAEENQTLYERLGGEAGIRAIVDDFMRRAMEDPRVNWSRQGITTGGWFRKKSVAWPATQQNVQRLKKHFVEFISLAAGGPTQYGGRPMQIVHGDMQIKKAEFDAAVGDLKATLDKLGVAPDIQKELLAIIESTRAQIVIERR